MVSGGSFSVRFFGTVGFRALTRCGRLTKPKSTQKPHNVLACGYEHTVEVGISHLHAMHGGVLEASCPKTYGWHRFQLEVM